MLGIGGTMANLPIAALMLCAAANAAQQTLEVDSSSSRRKMEEVLTSNSLIVGDLREGMEYHMPHNLAVCGGSFLSENRTASQLTNPGGVLKDFSVSGGCYSYIQYSEDSAFAVELAKTVDRIDDVLTRLQGLGFLRKGHALMFDIDNTMAYSGFNDTDFAGSAPPMPATLRFVKKWCAGWGKGKLDCVFITARYCTAYKARSTMKWLFNNFETTSRKFIQDHVFFSGHLSCSCCTQGNIAYKDVLREGLSKGVIKGRRKLDWVASIGDQYTDSVGLTSGIKIKLPNVWFDSSIVANQFSAGKKLSVLAWPDACKTEGRAPINPAPASCITKETMRRALQHSSIGFCLDQNRRRSPDQAVGCKYDISTGKISSCGTGDSQRLCAT